MASHFNAASGLCMKAGAGKLSSAAGLSVGRQFTDGYKEMRDE
jgi:hypothetical protein